MKSNWTWLGCVVEVAEPFLIKMIDEGNIHDFSMEEVAESLNIDYVHLKSKCSKRLREAGVIRNSILELRRGNTGAQRVKHGATKWRFTSEFIRWVKERRENV